MTHQSNLIIFNSALISTISSQFCLVHRTLEQKLKHMDISIIFTTYLLCENTIHQGTFLSLDILYLCLLSKIIVTKNPSISVQQLQQCKVLKAQLWNVYIIETTNITQLALICQQYSRISFSLPFMSAYNSFSVFKQFKLFLSLFKVLYYERMSHKQALKNLSSAYFCPSGCFLCSLLCSVWQKPQKLKGSGGYSLCYSLSWHNSTKSF